MQQQRLQRNPLRTSPVHLQHMPLGYMRPQLIRRWLPLRRKQFLRRRVLLQPPPRLLRGQRHRQCPRRRQVLWL
jgi:hypothetical protein